MSFPRLLPLLPLRAREAVVAQVQARVAAVAVERRRQLDSAAVPVRQPVVSVVVEAPPHRERCPCSPGQPRNPQL